MATTSSTTDSIPFRFGNLPPELRKLVYKELLARATKTIKQKNTPHDPTALKGIMKTCSTIRYQCLEVLHAVTYKVTFEPNGDVDFHGRRIRSTDVPYTVFPVAGIKKLRVAVEASMAHLCTIQDSMLCFFNQLRANQLQHLDVRVKLRNMVTFPPGRDRVPDRNDNRITQDHIAAFLSEPIRMLRGVRVRKESEPVVRVQGKVSKSWERFDQNTRAIIMRNGNFPVSQAFTPYFGVLRRMLDQIDTNDRMSLFQYFRHHQRLIKARISGDLEAFKLANIDILDELERLRKNNMLCPKDARRLQSDLEKTVPTKLPKERFCGFVERERIERSPVQTLAGRGIGPGTSFEKPAWERPGRKLGSDTDRNLGLQHGRELWLEGLCQQSESVQISA
jgi:hypothetical protein